MLGETAGEKQDNRVPPVSPQQFEPSSTTSSQQLASESFLYHCTHELGMAAGSFDQVWELFSVFNIPYLYDRYGIGVDFVLAFLFFQGVTQVTIGRKFTGKGGTLLTIAVSLLLSTGLSVAEAQLKFSLAAFGPVAIFFIVFIVALVLYQLSRHLGCHASTALSLAFVMIYLSIQAVSPSIMDLVQEKASWLRAILFLLFILSASKLIYNIVRTIFSRNNLKTVASEIEADPVHLRERDHETELEEQEIGSVKKQTKLSKKSQTDSEDIIQRAMAILQILETEGVTPFARKKIAEKLVGIADSEHNAEKRLRDLQAANANLKRSDADHLNQLRQRFTQAQGSEKERLRREIQLEDEKFRLHEAIENLGQRISGFMEQLKKSLQAAAEIIAKSSYPMDSRPYLQRTIQIEQEIRREIAEIQRLEKDIAKCASTEKDLLKGE